MGVTTPELLDGIITNASDDRFNQMIGSVLANEGGYVFNPHDPGGETNYGISKRSYPDLDIKNLTKDDAIAIYKRDWWEHYPFDKINDFALSLKLFDSSVNLGAIQAAKLLQRAVGGGLKEDGFLGPISLAAINREGGKYLLGRYKEKLADFYRYLVRTRPASEVFLKGWLARVAR